MREILFSLFDSLLVDMCTMLELSRKTLQLHVVEREKEMISGYFLLFLYINTPSRQIPLASEKVRT
jgi:hypothetical protein